MDATTMRVKTTHKPSSATLGTQELLKQLRLDYPEYSFVESSQFSWHAGKRHVSYRKSPLQNTQGGWAILHELGHALLDHSEYTSDIELVQMEVAAWEKAHALAQQYDMAIDGEYVQDCLDSYRDWLHVRATCPTCFVRCLQSNTNTYSCHNCGTEWHVTRSRLCRPYRRKK
ncbi:hypothetical protein IPL85_03140 [Candidatus Saccharibacteria bacterium]|nr:MAG: hypothetical protein IPL85_03140 [Candidatus Saccharibacteria bacterium]